MRDWRVSTSSRDQETGFAPGDLVREFGRRMGWNLVKCNVMFEGTTDVSYCNVANRLYFENTGRNLIDNDFHVMAIGERDQGGTYGIRDRLQTLQAVLQSDPSELEMSVVCVVDDDHEGRKTFAELRRKFQPWRDLFKLNRVFPRTPTCRSPQHFEGELIKANAHWLGLDCDIEDLIADEIVEYFISENPRCLKTEVEKKGGRFHRKFQGYDKPKLVRFVEQHASLSDLSQIVEILKSLRWLLRLDSEGS